MKKTLKLLALCMVCTLALTAVPFTSAFKNFEIKTDISDTSVDFVTKESSLVGNDNGDSFKTVTNTNQKQSVAENGKNISTVNDIVLTDTQTDISPINSDEYKLNTEKTETPQSDNEEIAYADVDTVIMQSYYDNTAESDVTSDNLDSYYYLPTGFNFASQLDERARSVFDTLIAAIKNDVTTSVVTFTPAVEISGSTLDEMKANIAKAVTSAMFAISRDYPEFFWVYGYSYRYGYYASTNTIANVELTISFYPTYTPETVKSYYDDLMAAVDSFKVYGLNRYEKIKSIHDSIAAMTTYDPYVNDATKQDPYAHQPVGALIGNHIAVCEGYAESFKLICDREGIPCVIVTGDNHMWNYVQMEDGKWYMLDITWDDQSIGLLYDYFLCGLGTAIPHFSATDCSTGHTEELAFGSYSLEEILDYPTLTTGDYSALILGINAGNISVDESNDIIYIMPGTLLNNSTVSAKSGTMTYSGNSTGSYLTYSNGGKTTTYTVVMYGDVNSDSTAGTEDFTMIKSAAVDAITLSPTQLLAADLNRDGAVDGFDAFCLNLYLSGNKTQFYSAA